VSDETVRPALTAEEWARLREPYAMDARISRGKAALIGALHHLDEEVGRLVFAKPLAAVALCPEFNGGQPFGFTREDVWHLRALLAVNALDDTARTRTRDLADRIAALLPPEGP